MERASEQVEDLSNQMTIQLCRMHENPLPKPRDIVLGRVTRFNDTEIYVELIEYNNMEALLPTSSIAKRRIKNISSYVKIGKECVLEVARVDAARNHIDLDERSIIPEDKENCKKNFAIYNTIHSLMRHVAYQLSLTKLIVPYKVLGWPAARDHENIYEAFKQAVLNFDGILGPVIDAYYADGYTLRADDPDASSVTEGELNWVRSNVAKEKLVELLKDIISTRLKPRPVKIFSELKLTSLYDIAGVEIIKNALRDGLVYAESNPIAASQSVEKSEDEVPLSIRLLVPPLYSLTMTTMFIKEGKDLLLAVMSTIKASIVKHGGTFSVEKDVTINEKVE